MRGTGFVWRFAVAGALAVCGAAVVAQGPLTPGANLQARTDSNGYLITSGGIYTAPDGPLTPMGNLRMRTDSNGYLLTTVNGGFVAVGTSPAQSGSLRIPNGNTQFNARNAADSADVALINLGGTDVVRIGAAAATSISFQTALTTFTATTFAALATPANGSFMYCSDCTIANPCAGSGTGAFAKRLNGVWVCN